MMYLVISIWSIIAATKATFEWSYTGPISNKNCVQWKEPSDPNKWHDNFLCSDEDFGIQWSYQGTIDGLRCTQIKETADPHTWHDNFLCVPPNSELSFKWSSKGPIDGLECVKIEEPADRAGTWHDNFLCYSFTVTNSPGFAGLGESCTLSMGNAETISAATGVGIDVIGQLVGLIPVVGAFGSAAISIAQDPAVDAIEQAIKDGAIICNEGLWCCNKQCQNLQTDWAGMKYCPHECKAGAFCPSGSCGRTGSKAEYESCSGICHEECAGNMKCCAGQCRNLQRDWAGVNYCPHECKGGIGCGAGTCPSNRNAGESCNCRGQCNTGCCENGRCVNKQRDWAGVYYCPRECKGGIGCGAGTCPTKRNAGQSCSCRGQCKTGCCENGRCVNKQRDWAGVYYCPSECNGGCGWGGTCPNNRNAGQSCSCRAQCNTGCCEHGRCVNKKRDWAGVYYCPAECRGGAFSGAGTC